MSFNMGYKKKKRPLCKLCDRKITHCNREGPRRRAVRVESEYRPYLQPEERDFVPLAQSCPDVTAYFPFCSGYRCSEFAEELTTILDMLVAEIIRQWDVPVSALYGSISMGVVVGLDQEPVWTDDATLFIPEKSAPNQEQHREQMQQQLRRVLNNLLDSFHHPIFINSITVKMMG